MSTSDDERLRALRELIPATGAGIYLDTAYRGPLPAETAAAMRDADDWELRVGRAGEGREEDFAQKRDEARAVIAALIGANPDDVYLASSSPDGLVPLIDPGTGAITSPAGAIDATLAVGAIPVDVSALDVDLVYFAADRWLLAPEGTGAIWTTRSGLRDADLGRTQVLGLARSIGWLEMYVTLDWIFEGGAALTRRLFDALAGTPGVTVVTPSDALATIVAFRVAGWSVEEALEELRHRVFAIIGSTPDGAAVRASVAWFNTEDEIDRFAEAVAELARYTPETLPRKPTLLVH
jgi:selenocysteine lyase/cysteine desulfurase